MVCIGCENKIKRKLKNMKGVTSAKLCYSSGTAEITYNENAIDSERIIAAVEQLGYTVETEESKAENQKTGVW